MLAPARWFATLFVGCHESQPRTYSDAMTPALSAQAKADAPVELRNAVRFPLQIPLRLFTATGEIAAMTENISATGVAFTLPRPLEVQTQVRFTMKMPAEAMGTPTDVVVHCTGRVVRCNTSETCWRAAAVIDEYYFSQ
jgi:PilZ domain